MTRHWYRLFQQPWRCGGSLSDEGTALTRRKMSMVNVELTTPTRFRSGSLAKRVPDFLEGDMAMFSFCRAARSIATATLLSIAAVSASEASTQNAATEWCALYDEDGGKLNCSFDTLEDCSAALPVGKWCRLNPLYTSDSHEGGVESEGVRPSRSHDDSRHS